MKRSREAAHAGLSNPPNGLILAALISSCVLVYSSAAYALACAWHWLTTHLSHWQSLELALTVALPVQIYLSIRKLPLRRSVGPP